MPDRIAVATHVSPPFGCDREKAAAPGSGLVLVSRKEGKREEARLRSPTRVLPAASHSEALPAPHAAAAHPVIAG